MQHFFLVAVHEDKLKSAQSILNYLNNTIIKCYFFFLKFVLNYFNSFNALFQSRTISIHTLHGHSMRLLKDICQNFVKPNLINENVHLILFSNKDNLLPIDEIFIGSECQQEFKLMSPKDLNLISEFKKNCCQFYCKAAEEIVTRLPVGQTIFKEFIFLNPEIALSIEGHSKHTGFSALKNKFNAHIDVFKIEEE